MRVRAVINAPSRAGLLTWQRARWPEPTPIQVWVQAVRCHSCRFAKQNLSVAQLSFGTRGALLLSQDRSTGLVTEDGGVGCLFLWVSEMAVCAIPILKHCQKRDWIYSEREEEGRGGRAETNKVNMSIEEGVF